MACYSPIHGFKGRVTEKGTRPIAWHWKDSDGGTRQTVPCGKCVGCKLAYSKSMAVRCVHEAQMHAASCFLTLTYDDEHLPDNNWLDLRDAQLFFKRFREYLSYDACRLSTRKDFKIRDTIRYFGAGEYGTKLGRPHFHILVFGYDFPDKLIVDQFKASSGKLFYRSETLLKLWGKGHVSIGEVNFASAAYVARYCLKKVGDNFDYFKEGSTRFQVDKRSGDIKVAEFTFMSRRPGIGYRWFEKFQSDVFPSDEVIVDGKFNRPPRYYDYLLDKYDPDLLESLKLTRAAKVLYGESTDDRLAVKEEVVLAKLQTAVRSLGE